MANNVARIIISVDNRGALVALQQTSAEVEATSGKVVAADERTVAANKESTASFAEMKHGVTLLGTIAFAALGYAMDKSVKAAIAWQSQQAALQQTMKNTGTYSAAAVRGINAQAEALATHGGFAESDQITAITALIAETHSLTAAQNLNRAATNLARGAHIGYAAAVQKVQGAEVGRLRGLDKLIGVIVPVTRFTYGWSAAMKAALPAQYAQRVEMNKAATAQMILSRVQKTYGDQTAAYSRTVSGALSNLRNSFEIILRQLGQALLPTVNRVAKAFAAIGDWITSHMGFVKELGKNILVLAAGVGTAVVVWKAWNEAIKVWNALSKLAETNPWMLALTALALLATVIITNWHQVSGAVMTVLNAIGTAATDIWDGLKTGFKDVVDFIVGLINKFIIAPINAVLTIGGLFNIGQSIPNIPSPFGGGGASQKGPMGGPYTQANQASNSSVPSVTHRAGGDIHTAIPITVNIDGRTVAETVVHHIQKRAALS